MIDLGNLEKNSRTMREARRGRVETLAAIVAVIVSLFAVVANAGVILQASAAAIGAVILLVTLPRWGRVRRYRRQDHLVGKVRKGEDARQ